jgi:hypothetical protein
VWLLEVERGPSDWWQKVLIAIVCRPPSLEWRWAFDRDRDVWPVVAMASVENWVQVLDQTFQADNLDWKDSGCPYCRIHPVAVVVAAAWEAAAGMA